MTFQMTVSLSVAHSMCLQAVWLWLSCCNYHYRLWVCDANDEINCIATWSAAPLLSRPLHSSQEQLRIVFCGMFASRHAVRVFQHGNCWFTGAVSTVLSLQFIELLLQLI